MTMLNEVLDHVARARGVLHQHHIDSGIGDRSVKGNHRSLAKQGTSQARLSETGRDYHDAVHMALQHLLHLGKFGIRVFV